MRASSASPAATASLVRHRPDVVALEAEVLDAEAGRARARPCPRSRRRSSGRGRRACPGRGGRSSCPGTARARRSSARRGRGRGSAGAGGGHAPPRAAAGRAEDEIAERDGREDAVDRARRSPSVPLDDDARRRARRRGGSPGSAGSSCTGIPRPRRAREGLPHLARAQARIAELLDQGRHVRAAQAERSTASPCQSEKFLIRWAAHSDADLATRDAPDLLRVRAEEGVVEAPAEAGRDPVLERLRGLGRGRSRRPRYEPVQRADSSTPSRSTTSSRLERVGEVLAVVVDAREPGPGEELVAEHVLPQPLRPGSSLVKKRWPPRSNR